MSVRIRALSIGIFAGLLVGVAILSATTRTAAQTSAETKTEALAAAERGEQLFNEGKYADAMASFEEAEKRIHAPTFLLMIARAQEKLGRLVEARATYQRIVDEPLPRSAPAPFLEAQAQAKKELEVLAPRIPVVTILVDGAPVEAVQVTVDGVAVPVGRPLRQDPGEHAVSASAPGRISATQKVALQEGAQAQVTLELTPMAAPPRDTATARPDAAPGPGPAASTRGYTTPAVITLGFAGVAVGVGAVTGAMSSGEVTDLEQQCPGNKCYNDAADAYSSARTLATVSTISFVVGGIAAAGGVLLLVMDSDDGQPATTGLVVGPGWLGARGAF